MSNGSGISCNDRGGSAMGAPTKKGTRKRKGGTKRPTRRLRIISIDEDDGTQVEDTATVLKRKGKTKKDAAEKKKLTDGPVLAAQLKKFVTETLKTGVNGLAEQFLQLKMTTSVPPPKTVFDANRERNRYKDVICVDRTRVILKWPANAASDYIHANWVEFKGEKRFICTQAPIEPTIDDFWRLIWQEKCKSIVMLCELVEQNKKKCEAYWPATPQETMDTASGLTIKNTQIQPVEMSMTVTMLEVTCKAEAGFDTLTVKHYKWNNWPDRGVPDNRMAPFRLFGKLGNDHPVIIHCSAGIGRTGTIVGLHMALQVLHAGEDLQLVNVVRELRAQRHGSVQTDTQYLFMHRTLLQLAENKCVCTADEIEPFSQDYEKFIKERGG